MFQYILTEINRFITTESKKIIRNIGWLFFDKVFRMGMALLVGAWVARYLGPTQFGSYSYLLATVNIIASFAGLGLDSMVVNEIVNNPQRSSTIISTTFTLRVLSGILSFLICVCIFFFLKHDEINLFYVGVILALVPIAQSLNTIEFYYQAQVASRIAVISNSIAYILMSICKIIAILSGATLMVFAAITSIEIMLGGLFMLGSYRKMSKQHLTFAIDKALAKYLLQKSWPLIFAGFMITIYMRIDQIMLGEMVNDYAVGTYSAALKLSEIWYFLPAIICTSFFPSIIEAKKLGQEVYFRKFQRLFDMLFFMSVSIALLVTFSSGLIIDILYGDQYTDAALILAIHIWTAVFVFLGVASSNFFIIENLQIKSFTRTAIGAVLNIVLNLILIPRYFAIGAAISTLISQFCSAYLFDLLSRKTRILFAMKTRALFAVNLINRIVMKS